MKEQSQLLCFVHHQMISETLLTLVNDGWFPETYPVSLDCSSSLISSSVKFPWIRLSNRSSAAERSSSFIVLLANGHDVTSMASKVAFCPSESSSSARLRTSGF